ncbi:MAG: DUF2157 domain-containing protein [Vicinamibacterales bacterium]
MNTVDYLDRWRAAGFITATQHSAISGIVRKQRMSVFVELNALLYFGVLAFAGGLAWTARVYADRWGDAAILVPATAVLAASLFYCFSRVGPYSPAKVETPSFVFDYVLYLACLVFAVELGYVEYRFELLQAQWDNYLLGSSVLFFAAAYRFDNRFVLSLAIATLGGWFGVRLSSLGLFGNDMLPASALTYGLIVAVLGVWLYNASIKQHFLDTYFHVATNVVLGALVVGAAQGSARSVWLAGLVVGAAAAVANGIRLRRFVFVVYGVGYGSIGVSSEWLRHVRGETAVLLYFVVSGVIVVVGLFALSRRFGRDA